MSNARKNTRTNTKKKESHPGYTTVRTIDSFTEYKLRSNGLTVLYHHIPGTGVVTTNITYRVGSRDEGAGESGLAHMLEHMLFKPTTHDRKRKTDSGAMHFEHEIGCNLNANTSNDRTTYYFCTPAEHLERALSIESERMQDVILDDSEFQPERNNVLSEFDMYNGDPEFALAVQMVGSAFHLHPYGHEVIGFREDIERYTPEKLARFYRQYYQPNNATMMIIGDVTAKRALTATRAAFESLENPLPDVPRHDSVEPKQEGQRRVEIVRPSATNILAIGIRHDRFPTSSWFATAALLAVLTEGPESILHKAFVDTGKVSTIDMSIMPSTEPYLGILFFTLAPGKDRTKLEKEILDVIRNLNLEHIKPLLKKGVERTLTDEKFVRSSSLGIARELTEYVASGDWTEYFKTEERLRAITAAAILTERDKLFDPTQLIIGNYIGKQ